MTRLFVLILLSATIFAACKKDKFQTKPSLTLKSMNGNVVPINGALQLDFEYTDKEGDVSNVLFLSKVRTNKLKTKTLRDTIAMTVPEFPNKNQGTLQVTLEYQGYLISAENPPKDPVTGGSQADTLLLKFVLRDRANNVSDTVTAGPVIVLR